MLGSVFIGFQDGPMKCSPPFFIAIVYIAYGFDFLSFQQ
jgi:hypothetical protein